jgi:two-component system, NarL family, sensor histidine kinase UhpB
LIAPTDLAPAPDGVQRHAPRPLRALVVEDSPDDFELLQHALRRHGFALHATRVEDAGAMREALAREPWDIVLSDHNLPRFSSREALGVLREHDASGPFIIVSGAIGEEAAVEAMRSGADDYVMKRNLARLGPSIERSLRMQQERLGRAAGERRLAGLAENLPGAVLQLEYDLAKDTISLPYVSEGAMTLFGVPPARLMGEPGLLIAALHDEDRDAFVRHVRASAHARAPLGWESRLTRPNGDVRWIAVTASPRPVTGGSLLWDGLAIDITALKSTEIQLRSSRERLRALSAHFERVKEEERTEVAREIHDDIGALLTGAKSDIGWLKKRFLDDDDTQEKVRDLDALLDEVVLAAKRIAKSLRPAILDQGIAAAGEWLARDFAARTGVQCEFTSNDEELLLEPVAANTLFRALQEALTNVTRHARATHVDVHLFADPECVTLEIRDDGVGMAPGARAQGGSFGLRGMEERVGHLGGWIDVNGAPGEGTTVMISIPRYAQAPA